MNGPVMILDYKTNEPITTKDLSSFLHCIPRKDETIRFRVFKPYQTEPRREAFSEVECLNVYKVVEVVYDLQESFNSMTKMQAIVYVELLRSIPENQISEHARQQPSPKSKSRLI